MRQPPILGEIAKALDLSHATVSMCLSGQAAKYRIKQETIERVKKYAAEVGYVPNQLARHLSAKRGPPPIGLLLHNNNDTEKRLDAFHQLTWRLGRAGRDYVVQNFATGRLSEAIARLKGYGVRDVVALSSFSPEYAERHENIPELLAISRGLTLHLLDFYFPMSPRDWWPKQFRRHGIDRQALYHELFSLLRETGTAVVATEEFCADYARAAGFARRDILLVDVADASPDNFDVGKRMARKFHRAAPSRPCTIVLRDDRKAAGMIDELFALGLRVPEDVGVIGFDNIGAGPYFRVPLTTVDLPLSELAATVIDGLLAGVTVPEGQPAATRVIWRASCICPTAAPVARKAK